MRRVACALLALLGAGCRLDLSGAPCASDDNCPVLQYCDEAGKCIRGEPSAERLVGLRIALSSQLLPVGADLSATALATQQDTSEVDVTPQAVWTSASPEVIGVLHAADGGVTLRGVSTGETDVAAELGRLRDTVHLVVSDAALKQLEISPENPVIAAGTGVICSANGLFSDGTRPDLSSLATWTSSDPAVLIVSNEDGSWGRVTALRPGTARVTAQYTRTSGEVEVRVTSAQLRGLSVSPAAVSASVGGQATVSVTGTFSDGSKQELTPFVQWSVDDFTVATFSNPGNGLVTGLSPGSTTIRATFLGQTGTASLAVTP